MKAMVFHGPDKKAWEEVPDATIQKPTDVVVKVETTTICGTDLHILKGDVPAVQLGDQLTVSRRSRHHVLHKRLRALRHVQGTGVLALPRRRGRLGDRLDLRPPD